VRTAARWAAPLLMAAAVAAALLRPPGDGAEGRPISASAAVVVVLNGVSFEQLMSVPAARAVAGGGGGAALLVPQAPAEDLGERLRAVAAGIPRDVRPRIVEYPEPQSESAGTPSFDLQEAIERAIRGEPRGSVVVVAGATPSAAMLRRGDGVLPIVLGPVSSAPGSPERSPRSLTSDATRRDGVVSTLDVPPTVLRALGGQPSDLAGATIVPVASPAPAELHRRYLEMRRMTVPVQATAWIYVAAAAATLLALLRRRDRTRPAVLAASSWVGLSVAPLAVALFAAGHLASLSYATVIPFVVGTTIVGTAAAIPFARGGVLAPPAAVGAGVLAYLIAEAFAGFSAALTPLVGGSQLDGGRFYGAPNVLEGLAVGAAIYVAANTSTGPGAAVLAGVALLLGLPQLGADIGGAAVAFSAMGLWLAVRRRGGLDPAGLAQAAAVAVIGTALVLAVHRFWPGTPTHATAFVGSSSRDIAATVVARLAAGGRLIATNPFAALPAIGVVAMAAASAWPPRLFAAAFERVPRWRDASLVLSLAGVVALVGNDSGPAAAGFAFGLALGGTLYVSVRVASGKMDDDESAAAAVD
jgi:hypothetical protein